MKIKIQYISHFCCLLSFKCALAFPYAYTSVSLKTSHSIYPVDNILFPYVRHITKTKMIIRSVFLANKNK